MAQLRLVLHDFRHAREILMNRPAWAEFEQTTISMEDRDVIAAHKQFAMSGRREPAGGQSALNVLFRERLIPLGWEAEPRLFDSAQKNMRGWKMDFLKGYIGVEVSFNHAEAVPWTFTRLNLAGESNGVTESHRIDVGIACFATDKMKSWAKMDAAVGTFELACVWLELMRPIMPIPILVVGLDADGWPATDVFRGTRKSGNSVNLISGEAPIRGEALISGESGTDPLHDADN